MADIQFVDPPEELSGKPTPAAEPSRYRFRLVDLIAIVIAVGLLVVLLLPATRHSREPSRRMQCTNNLRQIGLAVHNFHDTYNGLPPLALGDARASFFVHLYPFAEAANVYNLGVGGNEKQNTNIGLLIDGSSSSDPISTWAVLTPTERDAAASIKWMVCPTRRSGIQQRPMTGISDLYAGPLGDYAVVFIDQDQDTKKGVFPPPDVTPQAGWHLHQDPCDRAQVERQKGAIRLAHVDCEDNVLVNRYLKWKPRDTFARMLDGTANTIIVGEKHLRPDELGRYSSSMDDQDGVYWFTSNVGGRNFNVARNIGFPLANGKDDARFLRNKSPTRGPDADFGFGSWHSGVVQFLLCDGSVKSFNVTTEIDLMQRYAHTDDNDSANWEKE